MKNSHSFETIAETVTEFNNKVDFNCDFEN